MLVNVTNVTMTNLLANPLGGETPALSGTQCPIKSGHNIILLQFDQGSFFDKSTTAFAAVLSGRVEIGSVVEVYPVIDFNFATTNGWTFASVGVYPPEGETFDATVAPRGAGTVSDAVAIANITAKTSGLRFVKISDTTWKQVA